MALLALLALLGGAGCQQPCRPGTLFVELTLAGAALQATQLHVTATVGTAHLQSDDLPYHGQSRYGLEVDFPGSYPADQPVTLVVVASGGTTTLAMGSLSTTLAPRCTHATLTVGSASPNGDGGGGGGGSGGGGDGGAQQVVCSSDCEQLDAISPTLANGGATLTLEGTFDAATVVHFPGGVDANATVLGPHRATVVVPATASTGDLTVTTGSKTVGPLHVQRASFALGLGRFAAGYPQSDSARAMPTLVAARFGHSASRIGGRVLVVGGTSASSGLVTTVESASFNADGSLTPFTTVAGLGLATPRTRHAAVVIGQSLYVLGGAPASGSPALASVERLTFDAAGTPGSFQPVPGSALTTGRAGASAVVVGSWLYLLGGSDGSHALASVERAAINPDGTLSAFALVDGVTLATARADGASLVAGNTLFVSGGNGAAALASVEAATIGPDGALGAFASVGSLGSARSGHAAFVVGSALYVAGGLGGAGALASVERAALSSGGTLGSFASAGSLARARGAFAAVEYGGFVHAIGGSDGTREVASVERADLDAGGALSSFTQSADHLVTARSSYSAAVIGNRLYLVGGYLNNATLSSVEYATIAADGSLSAFSTASIALTTARAEHAAVVTGSALYVIGGAGPLASVESASIGADGSLGPFATSGVTLTTARAGVRAAVIGGSLCAFGGAANAGSLASIECASIAADGSLGSFAALSGVNLVNGRRDHSSAVIGDQLYALAGVSANGERNDIEVATSGAGGGLGSFSTLGVALANAENAPAAAVVGDSLYVLGGYATSDGFTNRIVRATLDGSGTLANVAAAGTFGSGCSGATAVRLGNFFYLLGGLSSSSLSIIQQATLQ